MAYKKLIDHIERHFLNENPKDGMAAFICAEVTQSQTDDTGGVRTASASLSLSDCSRNITLDFGWYFDDSTKNDNEIKARMKKLALLKAVISRFEKELKKAEKNTKKWLKSKKSSGATVKSLRETS